MPPARKDPSEEDDPSRPSTSRAFSPVIPPIKRARTSTGVVPSVPRRQSKGGGRQSRIENFIDEKDLQDRLLIAVSETADEILKEEEEEGKEKIEIESEVLSLTAGIVWDALAEDWAADLLAFSRHANRETIREDDVRLLMRRNPSLMEEIFGECEGEEGMNTMGGIKRRSTGGRLSGRPQKEPRDDDTTLFDDVTTPQGASSMTSVVPETPNGIIPLAHSTPMNRTMSRIIGADPNFSVPSPIREEYEEEGGKRDGRRISRSILDDLSATIREENEKREGGEMMEMEDHHLSPQMIDLRHPREQEDEERRMSRREEGESEQQPGPSRHRINYSREMSPELFGGETKKGASYDSFDDDGEYANKENDGRMKRKDTSHRMSESAALREMLDEEEEEKEKTLIVKEKGDSFDDNSIQFVEEKKTDDSVTRPMVVFLSTSPVIPTDQQPTTSTAAAAAASDRAAPVVSTKSLSSSQESFLSDDIVDVPPQPVIVPPPAAAPIVQQQPTAPAVQPARADDYDSFEDDDDDFVTPTSSKDTTPKAKEGPSPSNTVANRWSTVEVEEVGSQVIAQKNNGVIRGVFAEDIFGFNDAPGPSKKTPINKPSPTVPTWNPAAATVTKKSSPTVRISPSVQTKPSPLSSSSKETPSGKDGKAAGFSFFSDSPPGNTPTLQREDSDFLDTSTRQTTSTMKTPRGRGGRGRGFPRKVDPNSKINRKIREQSTPVRLSPRPPLRISEVVGSFEDDDFDVSAFDD
ncbi:hypothetical protein PRIPAC_90798 [Pristionchus pacificus]|nr:hypothetical protein PRIPAC_90798 [Pristionchus pacificus]